jgi:hypothetical protein
VGFNRRVASVWEEMMGKTVGTMFVRWLLDLPLWVKLLIILAGWAFLLAFILPWWTWV